jgi:chitinase
MKSGIRAFLALAVALSACSSGSSSSPDSTPPPAPAAGSPGGSGPEGGPPPSEGRRVVGYFPSWGVYARGYFVKNIHTSGAAARLTHINFAFANIGPDLKVAIGDPWADLDMAYSAERSVDGVADTWDNGVLRGSFNQLRKLKILHPHLKILISIGGWSWSGRFSDAALTPESRRALAASAIDIFIRGNFTPSVRVPGVFDGIDIDWEYPAAPGATNNFRPQDTENFTALLAEFRAQLDAQGRADGRRYLLTIAAPAGLDKIAKIQVDRIHPYLDFINLMTYDMHGAWEAVTNFHSPLYASSSDPSAALGYDTDRAVREWRARGTPADKLLVGVPFYGRGWRDVPPGPRGDGLYQTSSGGGAPGTYETGVEDYKVLKALEESYGRYRHPEARAFWIYSPTARIFWSYDDPEALREKAAYVRSSGLGGIMFWELSGDDPAGSLLTAISEGLR